MSEYEPEMGQMLFGQPSQRLKCPIHIEQALATMADLWDQLRPEGDGNPFTNSGARYKNDLFTIHAYDWSEDNRQEFNFKYRDDLRVSWYKYVGRGMSVSRYINKDVTHLMLRAFIDSIDTFVPDA